VKKLRKEEEEKKKMFRRITYLYRGVARENFTHYFKAGAKTPCKTSNEDDSLLGCSAE
jgi:hypothetical protein